MYYNHLNWKMLSTQPFRNRWSVQFITRAQAQTKAQLHITIRKCEAVTLLLQHQSTSVVFLDSADPPNCPSCTINLKTTDMSSNYDGMALTKIALFFSSIVQICIDPCIRLIVERDAHWNFTIRRVCLRLILKNRWITDDRLACEGLGAGIGIGIGICLTIFVNSPALQWQPQLIAYEYWKLPSIYINFTLLKCQPRGGSSARMYMHVKIEARPTSKEKSRSCTLCSEQYCSYSPDHN